MFYDGQILQRSDNSASNSKSNKFEIKFKYSYYYNMFSISKLVVALVAQSCVGAVALSVSAGTKRKRSDERQTANGIRGTVEWKLVNAVVVTKNVHTVE